MDRLTSALLALLLLGGCAAFLADDQLQPGDQIWRDAKRIGY